MRLRLSLIDNRPDSGRGPADVLIDAPDDSTFGELRRELVHLMDRDPSGDGRLDDVQFTVENRPLGDDAALGAPPLLRGAVVVAAPPRRSRMPPGSVGLADLRIVGGPGAGRTVSLARGEHVVGRSTSCSVRLDDPGVSRAHCVLTVGDGEITVRDLQPANPTRLAGAHLPRDGATLTPGATLRVGSTTLMLRQRSMQSMPHGIRAGRVLVHVRPRFLTRARHVEIHVPEEPRRPDGQRLPLLASLAPLVLSAALALAMRSPVMLLFALMSPVLLLGQWWSDRRQGRLSHRRMLKDHAESLHEVAGQVSDALVAEACQRHAEHPDLSLVLELVDQRGPRLWERRTGDDDWFVLRIGTASQPSRIVRTGAPSSEHPVVADVPVLVDLRHACVLGLAGPRTQSLALAGSLMAQVAAWHSPRRARIALLTGSRASANDWAWARLLPHVLTEQTAEDLCEASTLDPTRFASLVASFRALVDERAAGRALSLKTAAESSHGHGSVTDLLVVMDGARELRSLPGVADLLRLGPAHGVAFLCLDDDRCSLPVETTTIVELHRRGPGATMTEPGRTVEDVTPDLPGPGWLERLGRGLAPLSDATPDEQETALPSRVGFRELHRTLGVDPLDVHDLAAAWSRLSGAPTALLGITTAGPHEIDLARDGPHALVGGTTGSGKSELLQSLVAGLAATHRPDDLGFVLVDYKGGAAFRDCARLPHTLGLVTDLDEHLTTRALDSLSAELRRRERLLAEVGAKDLEAYRALRSTSGVDHPRLARLVIVLDEFKMLADELPDFVKGLVRIAATGRSLGVHLVLATQRPAGIITGDMRSNVSLRICLRVRDRADSDDVIDDAGAATLSEAAPGRAYLRAGDGQLIALQVAHVGGPVDEPGSRQHVTVSLLGGDGPPGSSAPAAVAAGATVGHTTPTGPTELEAFVDVARRVAASLDIVTPPSPWLPPLPHWVGVDRLADMTGPANADDLDAPGDPGAELSPDGVPFGLVDLPAQQRRDLARWDPIGDGHLGVIGGSRSGRTTLVRTIITGLAQRLPPSELHVHVLEGTPGSLSDLATLPHVGSVVSSAQSMLPGRLVQRLGEELLGVAPEGGSPALMVLVIDGWEAIEDALGNAAGGPGADGLLRLLRDGAAHGLRVIVTGGRAVGSGRLSSLLDRRLVLAMPDPLDLTLVGLEPAEARRLRGPGRAIDLSGGSTIQVATLGSGPSHDEQVTALRRVASSMQSDPSAPPPQRPWRIVALPIEVSLAQLLGPDCPRGLDGETAQPTPDGAAICLGVGGDAAEAVHLDTSGQARRLLIVGPPRSGRSNVLEVTARQLTAAGRDVAIIATRRSPLQSLAAEAGVHLLSAPESQRFVDLRRARLDLAVLIDDVEALEGSDLERVLIECVELVDDSGGLVWATADTSRANTAFRGLVPALARNGSGLVLCPTSPTDGDCLHARPEPVGRAIPGRGSLVLDSRCLPVQVARAHVRRATHPQPHETVSGL